MEKQEFTIEQMISWLELFKKSPLWHDRSVSAAIIELLKEFEQNT